MTSYLMDYDACRRLHPMVGGETEDAWRARLTQAGLVRFVTRQAMRVVSEQHKVLSEATCPVVVPPADVPQFAARDYTPKPDPEVAWHVANGSGDKTATMSRTDARDVRLIDQRQREATLEGRSFSIATEPEDDLKSEYDDRVIEVTPADRDDPHKYAALRDRAIKEGKQLRIRSGLAR
jgi:hypothetical protein